MNLEGAIRGFIFLPGGADASAPRPGGSGFPRPDDSDFTSQVIDLEPLDAVQFKTEAHPPAAPRRSHRGTIIDIRI